MFEPKTFTQNFNTQNAKKVFWTFSTKLGGVTCQDEGKFKTNGNSGSTKTAAGTVNVRLACDVLKTKVFFNIYLHSVFLLTDLLK